jgi:hypothetical protein
VGRPRRQLPPPLPPAERTVGQVIAETIRLYGERFWPSITLGLGPAVLFAIVQPLPAILQLPIAATAGSVLMTASYVGACVIVGGKTPFEYVKQGFIVGLLIWPTVALLPLLFAATGSVWVALVAPLPLILFWLGYIGMAVPAAVIERLGYRAALPRGMELGKADFVHVLGTLATLVITYQLTGGVMFFLLHGTSDLQLAVAGFLATAVISPMIFLGSALVYFDQKARLDKVRARASERSADADLHPADDADGPGSADAEVESRPPARSES